jgi:hypothetical protein
MLNFFECKKRKEKKRAKHARAWRSGNASRVYPIPRNQSDLKLGRKLNCIFWTKQPISTNFSHENTWENTLQTLINPLVFLK